MGVLVLLCPGAHRMICLTCKRNDVNSGRDPAFSSLTFTTTMEPELRLDPAIRLWVFLPIVLITFLVGIVRHYVSVLLTSTKKVDLAQVKDSQILLRARALRENARYIPKHSFLMRRHYLNNEENGVLKKQQQRQAAPPNPM